MGSVNPISNKGSMFYSAQFLNGLPRRLPVSAPSKAASRLGLPRRPPVSAPSKTASRSATGTLSRPPAASRLGLELPLGHGRSVSAPDLRPSLSSSAAPGLPCLRPGSQAISPLSFPLSFCRASQQAPPSFPLSFPLSFSLPGASTKPSPLSSLFLPSLPASSTFLSSPTFPLSLSLPGFPASVTFPLSYSSHLSLSSFPSLFLSASRPGPKPRAPPSLSPSFSLSLCHKPKTSLPASSPKPSPSLSLPLCLTPRSRTTRHQAITSLPLSLSPSSRPASSPAFLSLDCPVFGKLPSQQLHSGPRLRPVLNRLDGFVHDSLRPCTSAPASLIPISCAAWQSDEGERSKEGCW